MKRTWGEWRDGSRHASHQGEENPKMPVSMLKLVVRIQTLGSDVRRIIADKSGQDLIEYALVVALIAFAAAAGMTTVATKINTAFTNIGTKLTTYTS